ncbi:MAG: hypothetical protein PVI66_03485 [Candidatus Aminicenantes bacterium]|jgi:hypothetical protein
MPVKKATKKITAKKPAKAAAKKITAAKKSTRTAGAKKTTAKKGAKTTTAKRTAKTTPKKKTPAKARKDLRYECNVCGFRLIVDEFCGCVEEHIILCCNKPMKTKRTRATA